MAVDETTIDRLSATAYAFPRHEQTFPTLTAHEIERMRRFGEPRSYQDGEALFETGTPGPGMFVVLSGSVSITQRDGLGHVAPIIDQGPGQFLAEIGQLSGRPALVDGHADGVVEALLLPPDRLRALLVAEADLGERIMRALILRRVSLIQGGACGPVLIGPASVGNMASLQNFLARNGQPHHFLDPETDKDAADLVARYSPTRAELPLVVCPNGTVLRNPSEIALAMALGMIGNSAHEKLYDVAVVGSGPAGLATAVYAASEGLSVAVFDSRAFGGQAGASMRIENYLGFPTGISGQALAGRAFNQAQKFGAEMLIPVSIKSLDCTKASGAFVLDTACGHTLRAKSVVVASGARYRRPEIDNLDAFEGRGVWYWASPIEARLCANQDVVLVGGGNSAGQAAVYLSAHARRVNMMIRGGGLGASMSRYLIERIEATPNIELMFNTEVIGLDGAETLQRVRWRSRLAPDEFTMDIRNLFLFVGADPATGWLEGCGVQVDRGGFVMTGVQTGEGARAVPLLETTVPGVFAVGDVRSGSVKRVGGAIGEGAQVVAALHGYLADAGSPTL
ncbi:FAD-dependent oxidoreductase [Bradyrhizobium elkanii]|uniref:FAD-dependent oxidoreductase n=1 Tax=Bradyrhizobium elkanii TaxID=29448 RepID=UPI00209F2BDE|nr:cyclic nucleotide-binding domain-containing thioredoxin-disulfide reductase [Bradyrhizobium elkanii]MCP1975096.1 thioredoxin reductase (NADPH) [Bradyrhizobium elkanii]MCS3522185.1 thioredoxin reductase (NADPH) [Bradyrhizobium elkanii]MCS4069839.1 thioredoxin reductase (NADPH) [Bradyrhizobium elkanii]MCS4076470.1 thioredoxin reductase (NADPH) [Bradyrhizobium elkanii]MCS4103399.1 thioredoxin reductase (NADPH) [Bradyrhizobium elkanii]